MRRNTVLNKARGSLTGGVSVQSYQLAQNGISVDVSGESVDTIDALNAPVLSVNGYLPVDITIHLLKEAYLSALMAQIKDDAIVGDITFVSDSTGQANITIENCFLANHSGHKSNGKEGGANVMLKGFIPANQSYGF